jgi:hypothetical protein
LEYKGQKVTEKIAVVYRFPKCIEICTLFRNRHADRFFLGTSKQRVFFSVVSSFPGILELLHVWYAYFMQSLVLCWKSMNMNLECTIVLYSKEFEVFRLSKLGTATNKIRKIVHPVSPINLPPTVSLQTTVTIG